MKKYLKLFAVAFCIGAFAFGISLSANSAECKGACLFAGPRLASLDSQESELLNTFVSSLINTDVNLSVLDWNNIAGMDVDMLEFLTNLQSEMVVSSPSEALNANVQLRDVVSALVSVAEASEDDALRASLNELELSLLTLDQTFSLNQFLQVDFTEDSFAEIDLNALMLITGLVELYNYENVLTTPAPIALSVSDLGLDGVASDVNLYMQVVEPPVYICDQEGSTFYSAAFRFKNEVDLVGLNVYAAELEDEIANELNLGLVDVNLDFQVSNLDVYVDVAKAEGIIDSIDYIAKSLSLDVVPGVVDIYVGDIDDSYFFDRDNSISPETDLLPGLAGSLSVEVSTVVETLVDENVEVNVKAYANGESGGEYVTFAGSFPETKTVGTSAVFVDNLMVDLLENLELQVSDSLGLLDPLLDDLILPGLSELYFEEVRDLIRNTVLIDTVDPLLEFAGVKIGQAVVTVMDVFDNCEEDPDPDPDPDPNPDPDPDPNPPRGGGGGPTPGPKPIPGPSPLPGLVSEIRCLETLPEIDLTFSDDDIDTEGYKYVDFLKRTRIIETGEFVMNGYEQDDRSVVRVAGYENPTLRYEMMKMAMLSNCLPILENIEGEFEFKDMDRVLEGTPAEKYVKRVVYSAYEYGIIDGYEDSLVRAYQPISRAEAMKILVRAADHQKHNVDWSERFTDVTEEDWFGSYVMIARNFKIVSGDRNEGITFSPARSLNRSEAAKVIAEMMKHSKRVSSEFKLDIEF